MLTAFRLAAFLETFMFRFSLQFALTKEEWCIFEHFFDPLKNASISPFFRTGYDFQKLSALLLVGNI